MDSQLQADNLAYVRQACVDGVGVEHIVKDFSLPVLFIMCLLGLLSPELSDSRVFKCDTPAPRGSLKSCAYAVWGFLGQVRMTMKYRSRPKTAGQGCQTQWPQVETDSVLADQSININAAGWVKRPILQDCNRGAASAAKCKVTEQGKCSYFFSWSSKRI